jgi:hypothetical protein
MLLPKWLEIPPPLLTQKAGIAASTTWANCSGPYLIPRRAAQDSTDLSLRGSMQWEI